MRSVLPCKDGNRQNDCYSDNGQSSKADRAFPILILTISHAALRVMVPLRAHGRTLHICAATIMWWRSDCAPRRRSKRVIPRPRDRHDTDCHQWLTRNVGVGHRVIAPGSARRSRRKGCQRISPCPRTCIRSRQIPVHGSNRHYAYWRAIRRFLRRYVRIAPCVLADRNRSSPTHP